MSAGVLAQISFGLESTWGTPVTPNKSIAVLPGNGIQTNPEVKFVQSIKAQLAKNSGAYKGDQKHDGGYETDFIPGVAAYLMKSAFGSVTSVAKSAPNAAVYDHTFAEQESKPSLTIEQAIGDITRRLAGCIVHTLNFSCQEGGTLRLKADVHGKSTASATKITPTYETIRPFNFADIAATGISIGGTVITEASNFDLTYTNNVEYKYALGSNDPQFSVTKASEVSGKFDLYLDATTAAEYVDMLNLTTNTLVITFTGDAIGSSSNYGLQFTIPKAQYKTASYPITEDMNMLSIDWEGIYDTATSKLLTAVLTNLTPAIT